MTSVALREESHLQKIAECGEKQLLLESQKIQAFNRLAAGMMIGHLTQEERDDYVHAEFEVMKLELKRRKLDVLAELGKYSTGNVDE